MKINTIAFQSKADHTQTYTDTAFCSCDLDLYPLSLIYKLDPDIHKTCVHAKMNFLGQVFQKLEDYRQTLATENIIMPHSPVVNILTTLCLKKNIPDVFSYKSRKH